jgi:hypothetical protein
VNVWMKRAIGAAALGGSLLALGAGAASAQEVAADASARVGRPTSAQVRVCADGRVLSGLLGSCSSHSGTSASVRAGDGIRARVRVPRLASADASLGTRRGRPAASASGQAPAATRPPTATADADASADTSPSARADADASLLRPRAARLLDLRPLASLAGVGLLGSSPFTLAGDPATDTLLPVGELTLDDPAAGAPAGIGAVDSGPIASGNQADVDAGDVSPSVPVMVCGNGVGVLGDASASCGASQPATSDDASTAGASSPTRVSAGTGDSNDGSLLDGTASDNQVDAGIGSVSPSVPVTVCGDGVGLLGDASSSCGADTSSSGVVAPPPDTTPGGSTDTDGTTGSPGSTGTSGIPGTAGLTPGTSGTAGDPATAMAPLRPSVAGSLPFTGSASDLLAAVAAGLLATGVLIVRVARPATAAVEGGEDR